MSKQTAITICAQDILNEEGQKTIEALLSRGEIDSAVMLILSVTISLWRYEKITWEDAWEIYMILDLPVGLGGHPMTRESLRSH